MSFAARWFDVQEDDGHIERVLDVSAGRIALVLCFSKYMYNILICVTVTVGCSELHIN